MPIRADLGRRAIEEKIARPLGRDVVETAYGIHVIANANMMRAVKSVSTYRGRDPRDFSLLAFGGNGGVHGPELARALGIRTVVVPPAAGVFSAVGLLFADIEMSRTRAFLRGLDQTDAGEIEARFKALEDEVVAQLDAPAQDIVLSRQAAARYAGQAFELMVTVDLVALRAQGVACLAEAFEAEHERTYGHRFPGARTVQIVSLHVQGAIPTFDRETYGARVARGKAPGDRPKSIRSAYFGTMGALATPVIGRADLAATPRSGPLIVEEYDGTTVVPPDASARLDDFGNIVIALS